MLDSLKQIMTYIASGIGIIIVFAVFLCIYSGEFRIFIKDLLLHNIKFVIIFIILIIVINQVMGMMK